MIFDNLSSDDWIQIETRMLLSDICFSQHKPEGCMNGINKWWGKIAKIVFSEQGAKYACKALSQGKCSAFNIMLVFLWREQSASYSLSKT